MKNITFSGTQLKMIAIAAMTIDHIAWLLYPGFVKEPVPIFLHIIGRLTAPIMWYFIAEGCYYSRDMLKYFQRLFLFALISHFAFCFGLGVPLHLGTGGIFNRTSVMFPLSLSVLLVYIFKKENIKDSVKLLVIAGFCLLTFVADWSSIALMMPFFLYLHRGDKKKQVLDYMIWISVYVAVYVVFVDRVYGVLQFATLLSIPLLLRYNGKAGGGKTSKWFFYYYYPAHLVLIGILRVLMYGDISLTL